MFGSDELKDTGEDQKLEDELASFNKDALNIPLPDTKATVREKKTAVKKEGAVLLKWTRSQVDWIADMEVACFQCKKVKFEME